jgi:hypothetical protein
VPFLLFHFAVGDGELPFDNCLQAVMILFGKRGEFKWLAVPSHRGQHLGIACYAAIAAEEHQLSDHARLHRALQAQEAAGYGNYLQLRRASDAAGKSHHHRGFLFESDTLRPFTKFSLGGVGHELSISVLVKNREITEGQKSRSIRPTAKPPD